jgi:hypothetical protein
MASIIVASEFQILQSVYTSDSTDWCIYLSSIAVTVVEFYGFDMSVWVNCLFISYSVLCTKSQFAINPNCMNPISVPRDAAYTVMEVPLAFSKHYAPCLLAICHVILP